MNEHRFKILIENFSPELLVETFQKSHDFFRIKKNLILSTKNDSFSEITQLGEFELEDNTRILVISAKTSSSLSERSGRKNQYDIAKKILKDNHSYNAGIFVFYDNKGDFRMSLIYAEYLGTKVDYSTFRRFTYFVSNSLENVTFIQQVSPFKFTKLKELKELFSVEKVTREFFKKYRNLFLDTLEDFEKNEIFQNMVVKSGISTSSDFVKKMMGQIVFLYFVQKKGWLGVRPGENWGSGDQSFLRTLFTACKKSDKNYFNDYLEPLFYEALAEKRGADDFFDKLNCRVPFLNGGLFESVYEWEKTDIVINNKVFEKLLDFFDQYNFTVDENTPSDQEISVDPEMLGKIFEELLAVKDRKDKGAFYTPREIVHYMCRESLIQHLVSENTAPEERIRKIFEIKDTDLSVLIDNKKTEAIKKMQDLKDIADKVDISLRHVKIVDPAVGSGAFPMGMLNEISSVRYYLNSNFLHKKNTSENELSLYDIKKETLENCIYAVDLEPGAVEIAKLRFWLALIVEYDSSDSKTAPPTLPNLDYKIMQGNSLLEEYEGVKLFDEKIIETADTNKERLIEELKKKQSVLQKEYFDLHSKNKLSPIKKAELDAEAKNLHDQLKKLTKTEQVDVEKSGLFDLNKHKESKLKADELKLLQKRFFETNHKDKKESIKKNIERLEWELIEATLREQDKISELNKIQEFKKSNTKPFFLWKLHFADVFEQNGGFDIVIGNPPYVKNTRIDIEEKKIYKDLYPTLFDQWDIYIAFFEKGLNLLKIKGVATLITPNQWLTAKYGTKLRVLLSDKVLKLVDFRLYSDFTNAAVNTIVTFYKNFLNNEDVSIIVFNTEGGSATKCIEREKFVSGVENFGKFLSDNNNIINKIDNIDKKFGDTFKIGHSFSIPDFYKLTSLIYENKKYNNDDELKLVSTGTLSLSGVDYGKKNFKYDGKDYLFPVVKRQEYLKNFPLRKIQAEPKLIMSSMGGLKIDIDLFGQYLGTRPTMWLTAPTINQLKIAFALLNSKLINFYYRQQYSVAGMTGFKVRYTNIKDTPLSIISEIDNKKITNLVDDILENTKKESYSRDTEKQAEVKKLEHQIDELVYKLYDLTPEEIEIVENSSKK